MRTSKRKIALFMPTLAGGGAERVMLTLASAFVYSGLSVDMVLARAQGAYESDIPAGTRVVDLDASRIIASLPGLVRYLRLERPPLMLSALAPTNCLAVWGRELARVETRLVLSEHNTLSRAAEHAANVRTSFLPWLMRWSYRWSDRVVAVSQGVADDLAATIGLNRTRIEVIHNPVVSARLFKKANVPLNHHWFATNEPPVVLGVGRLTEQKDFATLIRAFARVCQCRKARLMILGEGPDRNHLNSLVRKLGLEEDVTLPGFVVNPYQYMANARVFVLSSRWEGFGNVLVEAMACGTSVISTECPSGPAEILDKGRYGKLVPVGDEAAMAAAILSTINQPEKAHAASLVRRANHFSEEHAVEHYLKLLEAVQRKRIQPVVCKAA